jgi:2'-5' RNA ligase
MSLLVIGYPDIRREDTGWIIGLRQRHPQLHHSTIDPHFTFIFPLDSVDEDQLAQHIRDQLAGFSPISFVLRCCMLVKNDSDENYFVLLIPDEGFSSIVKVHDRLYTGILASELRLDIPFIPHITLGYSSDAQYCRAIVQDLNKEQFEIKGTIFSLDLVKKDADKAWAVERFSIG